jgi:hypothetical protein
MVPNDWGFKVQGDKLIPIMMDEDHAPEVLLKMIHCNCSAGCNTLRCTFKKHGLDCTSACGSCQEGNCDNMILEPILDEDDDEEQ